MNTQYALFIFLLSDWSKMVGQSFFLVFLCIAIIVLGYYSTKWINKAKISGHIQGNIHVVEAVSVGLQNTLQLIKAGNKYILIGVSKDKIVFLTEVDPSELNLHDNRPSENKNLFNKYLNQFIKKGKISDSGDGNEENRL